MFKFLADRGGNVAFIFGLAIIPIMGFIGSAIDYGNGLLLRNNLQHAADAGALAGAIANPFNAGEKSAAASQTFVANWKNAVGGDLAPSVSVDGGAVTVAASLEMPTSVLGIIGVNEFNVSVTSRATRDLDMPVCMLALNNYKSGALAMTGSSQLKAINCAVYANSSSSSALKGAGNASAEAYSFCAGGGYGGSHFAPVPYTGCPPLQDPFANTPVPTKLSCDFEDTVFKKGTFTATPGVYCGGLEVFNHADVTFKPGLYVIRDGEFVVRTHSKAFGNDVTFYLYGKDAGFDIHAQSELRLTAPKTGAYAGLVIAQHAGSNQGHANKFSGGPDVWIEGALHLPTQSLELTSSASWTASSPFIAMVADSFSFTGNAEMTLRVDPKAGYPDMLAKTYATPRLVN